MPRSQTSVENEREIIKHVSNNNLSAQEIAWLLDVRLTAVYQVRKRYFFTVYIRNQVPLRQARRKAQERRIIDKVGRYLPED